MNTIQFDFNEDAKNSLIIQDLLFVESVKNLRVATGVAYSKGGFDQIIKKCIAENEDVDPDIAFRQDAK